MLCAAKKMEAGREEFKHDGQPDVDLVLTTQELIRMIKEVASASTSCPMRRPICRSVLAPAQA